MIDNKINLDAIKEIHPHFHTSNDLTLGDALQSINEVLIAFKELQNEIN